MAKDYALDENVQYVMAGNKDLFKLAKGFFSEERVSELSKIIDNEETIIIEGFHNGDTKPLKSLSKDRPVLVTSILSGHCSSEIVDYLRSMGYDAKVCEESNMSYAHIERSKDKEQTP